MSKSLAPCRFDLNILRPHQKGKEDKAVLLQQHARWFQFAGGSSDGTFWWDFSSSTGGLLSLEADMLFFFFPLWWFQRHVRRKPLLGPSCKLIIVSHRLKPPTESPFCKKRTRTTQDFESSLADIFFSRT